MENNNKEHENFISVTRFSELKGVSRPTVYAWIKKGKVKTVKVIDKNYVDLTSLKED